jgi:hypothetical protein
MKFNCKRCDKLTKYKPKNGKTFCKSCISAMRRNRLKNKCIEYKGGKCQICGYNKCNRALQFHHRDPALKKFKLDSDSLEKLKWVDVVQELDKCDMLCANCHSEVHDKIEKNRIKLLNEKVLLRNPVLPV